MKIRREGAAGFCPPGKVLAGQKPGRLGSAGRSQVRSWWGLGPVRVGSWCRPAEGRMRARRMGNLGEARGEGRHVQQGLRTGRTEPNPTVGVISPWCKWFLAVSLLGVDDAVAMRGEKRLEVLPDLVS